MRTAAPGLGSRCDNCKSEIRFKPEQAGSWMKCPFCQHAVLLYLPSEGRLPRFGIQTEKISPWVSVALSLIVIIGSLSFVSFKLLQSVYGLPAKTAFSFLVLASYLVPVTSLVLTFAFAICVSDSLGK